MGLLKYSKISNFGHWPIWKLTYSWAFWYDFIYKFPMFLYLFRNLFQKDFSTLPRINCSLSYQNMKWINAAKLTLDSQSPQYVECNTICMISK